MYILYAMLYKIDNNRKPWLLFVTSLIQLIFLLVQDLRKKYAGAVPLPQQEKFARQLLDLQQDKAKTDAELKEVVV